MSWFMIDGVKKSVTILLALLLLVSCTRLSYPEETRPMFGGEASVILTEGGDDMILERVFALLEELESEYESGVLPSDLQHQLKRAEELTTELSFVVRMRPGDAMPRMLPRPSCRMKA